jgi:hypothetical protein
MSRNLFDRVFNVIVVFSFITMILWLLLFSIATIRAIQYPDATPTACRTIQ